MRLKEFERQAYRKIALSLGYSEEQVDEAIPAIAATLARAGGGAGARAGTATARTVGNARQGAVDAATSAAQGELQGAAQGTQGTQGTEEPGQNIGRQVVQKVTQKAQDKVSSELLKRGATLPLPTQDGAQKDFEVDDVRGDEVTIANPDASNKPDEPEKLVYKKDDLEAIVKSLAQGQQQ
jgi:hypothetical protein